MPKGKKSNNKAPGARGSSKGANPNNESTGSRKKRKSRSKQTQVQDNQLSNHVHDDINASTGNDSTNQNPGYSSRTWNDIHRPRSRKNGSINNDQQLNDSYILLSEPDRCRVMQIDELIAGLHKGIENQKLIRQAEAEKLNKLDNKLRNLRKQLESEKNRRASFLANAKKQRNRERLHQERIDRLRLSREERDRAQSASFEKSTQEEQNGSRSINVEQDIKERSSSPEIILEKRARIRKSAVQKASISNQIVNANLDNTCSPSYNNGSATQIEVKPILNDIKFPFQKESQDQQPLTFASVQSKLDPVGNLVKAENEGSEDVQIERNRFTDKEFIPVTEEALPVALKILSNMEREKRCVATVFDSCFYLDDFKLRLIQDKYEPIFGPISPSQLFIRFDIPRLTKTPEEAYKLGFKTLNQAYIFGDLNRTMEDVNDKAAACKVLCCPMTVGCVRRNLLLGVYMMHRSIVIGSRIQANQTDLSSEPQERNNQDQSLIGTNSTRPKIGDRIAAAIDSYQSKQETQSVPLKKSSTPKIDLDLWNSISECGDVVLELKNLPLEITIHSLNIMMGTFSLKSDQVIAASPIKYQDLEVTTVMVVLKSGNGDITRLMEKSGTKLAGGISLYVKRRSHQALKQFMINHANILRKLEASDKLPIKGIGYGKSCQ